MSDLKEVRIGGSFEIDPKTGETPLPEVAALKDNPDSIWGFIIRLTQRVYALERKLAEIELDSH